MLADRMFAPHYARAELCHCAADMAMLRSAPDAGARAVSQLVRGEGFALLDRAGGWAWGRCEHDDYVGYLPDEALGAVATPSHCVTAPLALAFAAPDIKSAAIGSHAIGVLLDGRIDGDFLATGGGFVHRRHVAAVEERVADPVAVAERLVGMPYLWGGRGAGGIDCSGLVQRAIGFAGIAAPRDSDLQQQALGELLPDGAALRRGDLVFFPGHVGLMVDGDRLIHANAHWMAVTIEPLADVVARLSPLHERPVTARRRMDG